MKKIITPFLIFFSLFMVASSALAANSITNRLKGKLLLQTHNKGRIWYVDPVGLQKHEVTFANALSLFQKLALGITNADLIKIPADLESISSSQDSDGDGYTDRAELQSGYSPYIPGSNKGRFKTDNNLATKLKGRLLLQVQDKGRIWYIDQNGKRWEVTWGNLMSLFRKLALGITDKDLGEVGNVETASWQTYTNSQYNYEIKYPKGWLVGPAQDVGEVSVSFLHSAQSESFINISTLEGTAASIEKQISSIKAFAYEQFNEEDVMIHGITGKKVTVLYKSNQNMSFPLFQIHYFLPKDGYLYAINLFGKDLEDEVIQMVTT